MLKLKNKKKVLDFLKGTVQCKRGQLSRDALSQMCLIVHEGGGVGKSKVIKVCAQWTEQISRREYSTPGLPRVLLLCPTGMAASVIDSMTISSAFDFYFGNQCIPLSDQKLAFFKSQLQKFKIIIVDEMSMVSSDTLYKIHYRLTAIFIITYPLEGSA